MVSLARLWQPTGVTPDGVVGHSQAEVASIQLGEKEMSPDGLLATATG